MQQPEKNIHKTQLDNGITLITTENPTTEIIAGKIFCRNAGGLWENNRQAGIFHLLASVMSKGTRYLSSLEIADQVESIGAGLGTDATSDYFLLGLKTITDDFLTIFKLAGEILRYPSIPEKELELEKRITIQNILSQKEQPFNLAFRQLREMMYGNHPYSFSILGTTETVNSLTTEDLHHVHEQYLRPDNLVISLAGNITSAQAKDYVEEVFGDWQKPESKLPQLDKYEFPTKGDYKHLEQKTQQSIIMLGFLAPPFTHPDYPIFKLLTTYLGSGLSSRLFVELREKKGLAYDVSAFYPTRVDRSQFVSYIGTAPPNLPTAKAGLIFEINRLQEILLSTEEVETAKSKLLGQYALGKQTNAELAQLYGWYETLGAGMEYDSVFPEQIKTIAREDIQRVAQEYFAPELMHTSIVGIAEKESNE